MSCWIFIIITFSFILNNKLSTHNLKFLINGKVIIESKDSLSPNVKIIVLKNNKKDREVITNQFNEFRLELDYQNEYRLKFIKRGYITKEVYINTTLPTLDILDENFDPFNLNVRLLKRKLRFKN